MPSVNGILIHQGEKPPLGTITSKPSPNLVLFVLDMRGGKLRDTYVDPVFVKGRPLLRSGNLLTIEEKELVGEVEMVEKKIQPVFN